MFEGFTAKLNARKIEVLKKVEEQTIKREQELLEIQKLEDNIYKHKETERKRAEKSIERLNRLKLFMNRIGGKNSDTSEKEGSQTTNTC